MKDAPFVYLFDQELIGATSLGVGIETQIRRKPPVIAARGVAFGMC